jgi:hypothetical protein
VSATVHELVTGERQYLLGFQIREPGDYESRRLAPGRRLELRERVDVGQFAGTTFVARRLVVANVSDSLDVELEGPEGVVLGRQPAARFAPTSTPERATVHCRGWSSGATVKLRLWNTGDEDVLVVAGSLLLTGVLR